MAKGPVTRKLAAILAADMVGFSRLMGMDEAGTLARQSAHRAELIDPKIAEYNGRIVKTTGDGLLVEFGSAVDAVLCAVAVQRAMAEREADVPKDRQMAYRVGINQGDIIVEGDDIFGDGVNVAARLQALAEPGGIRVSDAVFRNVKGKLDLGFADLGPQKVKNIAEPVPTYKILLDPAQAGTVLSAQRTAVRRWRWAASTVAAVLLLVVAGLTWWQPWMVRVEPVRTARTAPSLPTKPSIAVLPFTNMSGGKSQEYFADGMTEDLITALAKISGLFVIARNSSFVYKGKSVDVRKVGRELGVRYILEGSVRKSGQQVRISAQLIDATSGQHLWAEQYDGKLADVFALQDKVTNRIVTALAVHLNAGEARRQPGMETNNATAYDAFSRGRQHYRRHSRKDYQKAIDFFKRAVELDPDYARAHAALALTYWTAIKHRRDLSVAPEAITSAGMYQIVEHQLRLALRKPTSTAYRVASLLALDKGRYDDAMAQAKLALKIEPNDAESLYTIANAMVFSGDPKGALVYIRRAMRLDPHYGGDYLLVLGLAQFGLDQFKEAATQFERALKRNPKDRFPAAALAAAYGHLGRKADGAAALKLFETQFPSYGAEGHNPVSIMTKFHFREPSDAERFGSGLLEAGMCCRSDLDSLIASLRARKRKSSE